MKISYDSTTKQSEMAAFAIPKLKDGGLEKWKKQNRVQNSSWKKMMC